MSDPAVQKWRQAISRHSSLVTGRLLEDLFTTLESVKKLTNVEADFQLSDNGMQVFSIQEYYFCLT